MAFVSYVNDLTTKFHDMTTRGITTNIALTFPATMASIECQVTLYVMPNSIMLLTSGVNYTSKAIECIENEVMVYDITTNEEAGRIIFDTVEPYGAVEHWMTEHASLSIETLSVATAEVLMAHYKPKFKHVEVCLPPTTCS